MNIPSGTAVPHWAYLDVVSIQATLTYVVEAILYSEGD